MPGTVSAPLGGSFLIEDAAAASVFTPEDFSEEQRQTFQTAARFMDEEIAPAIPDYEQKKPGLARDLIRKAGELGLLAILVPERYDGLELTVTTQMLVAEALGGYASFSTTYGAHAGIGTLPLVFFGTDEQKRKYLPRLVTGELLAAYCLSEPQAGSDALNITTRAVLSDDGKSYRLDGQKMWISNGGWADLFTVFAKVDGERFSAFLVERSFAGVRPGAEEHKMGIHGSSTTALFLDNVEVPAENALGEIGRGHIIAFNILNMGRLKLGASCIGGMKEVLAETIRYAKQRKAFGRAIAEFGAIRHKIAESAIRLYASESIVYRTCGMIDERLKDFSWEAPDAAQTALKAIEEYAIECSIAKIYCTESIDYIVDEGVQVHGGNGYHVDYPVERAYRDSRINRIFEGTNEINRLLTTDMLLKRAAQGRLDLFEAIEAVTAAIGAGTVEETSADGPLAEERGLLARAKKATLFAAGVAHQSFGRKLEEEQEVVSALSEAIIAVYALESALLRAEKLHAAKNAEQAVAMTRALARDSLAAVDRAAATVLGAALEGERLEETYRALRRFTHWAPINAVALRREIAARLIESERYGV